MTTFFLLRHGPTQWNADNRIQGNTNTDLSPEGRDRVRTWTGALDGLDIDAVLTSHLSRAMETAAILTEGLDLPTAQDPRLAEQDWGDWTGLTKPELKALGKELSKRERQGFEFRPPKGESREEVLFRACDALTEYAADHPEGCVLVVTHNGVIKALLNALSGLDYMPNDPPLPQGHRLHRIDCTEEELTLGGSGPEL
ncbi:histidine phosphatase family protein [Pseudodesulfovibrio sp.]|uniref:histidine phosphatase family protein n=1 Tax=unclassified Pseudodesulfovibrio TaxID=2661612 RepID=UPI003B009809